MFHYFGWKLPIPDQILIYIFHPIAQKARIFTKFGLNVPLVDLINRDKGFDFTGSKFPFSHRKLTSPL